jgi:ribosomal protein S18 acetylase RimI-like enzyme
MVQVRKIMNEELTPEQQAINMERTMMAVRRHWFGAQEVTLPGAISVQENGGELLMCLNGPPTEVEATVMEAVGRGAYVVVTSWSRPADLPTRLKGLGYRLVHRHGSYAYTPTDDFQTSTYERRGLLAIFGRRIWRDITVQVIDEQCLEEWNSVCWTAFGQRGTLQQSLIEKQRAFTNMGEQGRWYLAHRGGRLVGTACVYYGALATQVMAVGTLPSQQGRGVATAVMRQVITDWEGTGANLLFLDTRPSGAAERLYQRLGFRQSYIREVYAPAPSLA